MDKSVKPPPKTLPVALFVAAETPPKHGISWSSYPSKDIHLNNSPKYIYPEKPEDNEPTSYHNRFLYSCIGLFCFNLTRDNSSKIVHG
jgi:hypothetical protein